MRHTDTSAEHHLDRATQLLAEVDEVLHEGIRLDNEGIRTQLAFLTMMSATASAHAEAARAKEAHRRTVDTYPQI